MAATFEGFERPTANFTMVPNGFLEAMHLMDTLGEMKVVYYILRHTWGFQDMEKRITLDEFCNGRKRRDGTRLDNGTGLSKSCVLNGLRKAAEHGFILVDTDDCDAARIKKIYRLKLKATPEVSKADTCGSESIPRTEKDTPEKHLKKVPPPSEPERPPVNVAQALRRCMTTGEDEQPISQLAEYIGQQFHSPVPPGQRTKLAMGYTEQLPGGKVRKHPSPDELWTDDPAFALWVDERIKYVKGHGGSPARLRANAVNLICQYKGNAYAWLEWKERQEPVPEEIPGTVLVGNRRLKLVDELPENRGWREAGG